MTPWQRPFGRAAVSKTRTSSPRSIPVPKNRSYGTAEERWASLGPYYATFPREFAARVIERYCPPGGKVLDPFAGRGTSVFTAAASGRRGLGFEINPVGWIYGVAKLNPASERQVVARVHAFAELAKSVRNDAIDALPEFFHAAFSRPVLRFLLAVRANSRWKTQRTDQTVMSLLLTNLHGAREKSLSNQLRQTKSMSPTYAINWWKQRGEVPPEVDPVPFLLARATWRYRHGRPSFTDSRMILGDCTSRLLHYNHLAPKDRYNLLFTSPPYPHIADYRYDQWIRYWVLGGPPKPSFDEQDTGGRYRSRPRYELMLRRAFEKSAQLLAHNATVYVRTDARQDTRALTRKVLSETFPQKSVRGVARPFVRPTQTSLFGDAEVKPGEYDFILLS